MRPQSGSSELEAPQARPTVASSTAYAAEPAQHPVGERVCTGDRSAEGVPMLGRRGVLGWMGGISCAVGLAACRSSETQKRASPVGPGQSATEPAASPPVASVLSAEHRQILTHFADAVLPRTDTPAASEAGVPAFVVSLIDDVLEESEQKAVAEAFSALASDARAQMGASFSELDAGKRAEFLAQARAKALAATGAAATTQLLTQLHGWIVEGYCRSRDGATRTLRYEPVPGAYNGCVGLESLGGRAWATN